MICLSLGLCVCPTQWTESFACGWTWKRGLQISRFDHSTLSTWFSRDSSHTFNLMVASSGVTEWCFQRPTWVEWENMLQWVDRCQSGILCQMECTGCVVWLSCWWVIWSVWPRLTVSMIFSEWSLIALVDQHHRMITCCHQVWSTLVELDSTGHRCNCIVLNSVWSQVAAEYFADSSCADPPHFSLWPAYCVDFVCGCCVVADAYQNLQIQRIFSQRNYSSHLGCAHRQ